VILVCGIPSEPPVALVLHELAVLGAAHAVFNQRLFERSRLSVAVRAGDIEGTLELDGARVDLRTVRAVYARLMDDAALPELRGEAEESPRRRRCRDLHAALEEWLEITPALVVTRAEPNASNGSKTFQAAVASAHGFLVPETLVTNDPEAVVRFRDAVGRVVYKSTSGARSIVTELDEADIGRLNALHWCPVHFQELIEGIDVRVHVVGRNVFGTAVASSAVDYRYGDADLRPVDVAPDVADRCVRLAHALGLPFAGIDLRLTSEDAVYCLEINPSPAYSYYEQATGQPIARSLAHLLADGGYS
jgi:hypothetical protein